MQNERFMREKDWDLFWHALVDNIGADPGGRR